MDGRGIWMDEDILDGWVWVGRSGWLGGLYIICVSSDLCMLLDGRVLRILKIIVEGSFIR